MDKVSMRSALLRYNQSDRVLRGRISLPEAGSDGSVLVVGSEFGGAKVSSISERWFNIELINPEYEDFLNLGDMLGGKDSRKALSGMGSQINGKDPLVVLLSIAG